MVQKLQTTNNIQPLSQSRLEKFNLVFEYDKPIQQVKREMRVRTLEKI